MNVPAKGLPADILRSAGYGDCSNHGLSSRVDAVTVMGVRQRDGSIMPLDGGQVSEPTPERPAVVLVRRVIAGRTLVHAEPMAHPDHGGVGPMMGGCYIATADSRFADATGVYGAIALHDRFESTALYNDISAS